MAKYKKVCPHCGKAFETDSACRKYCYNGCSYEVNLQSRPARQQKYKEKKEREKLTREKMEKLFREKSIAEVDREAREAGKTYGQYVAWKYCQEEIAMRAEERKQGIRFFDQYLKYL